MHKHNSNNVLIIFGTRPESIKMAPVVSRLREAVGFQVKVAVTAQHRHGPGQNPYGDGQTATRMVQISTPILA